MRENGRARRASRPEGRSRSGLARPYIGAPPEGESGGDGVLVGAQAGNEGLECGLAGGGGRGHPLLAAAAVVHEGGGRLHVRGDGG